MSGAQPALTFRDATRADVPPIADLITQLNHAEGIVHACETEGLVRSLFAPHARVKMRCLLALRADQIVGAAIYYAGHDILSTSDGYHLADFVVDASCRRQGVGRALFAALARQNLAEGGCWISLTAKNRNPDAIAFYLSLGMTQVDVRFFAIGPQALRRLL